MRAALVVAQLVLSVVLLTGGTLFVRSLLAVGLSPHDPVTLAIVPLVLGAVVLAASWLPPRRATRLDPSAAPLE